jgi:peptidoglycan/xylan/chitin deacetylase (PgdA/CDA1 family)
MFAFPVLMYHEVSYGGERGVGDPLYLISSARFADQIEQFAARGFRVADLDEFRTGESAAGRRLALTFDDGTMDHHDLVLPFLLDHGLTATFFVTTSWVGRPGYLGPREVAALAGHGMSVQSHTHTHPYLDDLDADSIRDELRRSRDLIGEWTGKPPVHLSCPGGRTSAEARRVAREDGWLTICTSVHGRNTGPVDPLAIERLAIQSWHTAAGAVRLLTGGRGEVLRRVRHRVLDLAKRVLGNRAYESVRRSTLRRIADCGLRIADWPDRMGSGTGSSTSRGK